MALQYPLHGRLSPFSGTNNYRELQSCRATQRLSYRAAELQSRRATESNSRRADKYYKQSRRHGQPLSISKLCNQDKWKRRLSPLRRSRLLEVLFRAGLRAIRLPSAVGEMQGSAVAACNVFHLSAVVLQAWKLDPDMGILSATTDTLCCARPGVRGT